MKRIALSLGVAAILVAACSQTPSTPTPDTTTAGTPAATLAVAGDPCDKTALPTTVKAFTDLTREFDDTSYVASFTPQGQLAAVVLNLQDVRRRVQALDTPDCLKTLRKYQIDYMNGVITALVHFLGGAKGDQVQAEIGATRTLRAKYDRELATVLGITFVAPTAGPSAAPSTPNAQATTDTNDIEGTPLPDTPTAAAATPTADLTQTATVAVTGTAGPVVVTVIQRANLRRGPGTDFALVATLEANETTTAVGRTASGEWIQVESTSGPDGKAWLLASLVTFSSPADGLPVVNPP